MKTILKSLSVAALVLFGSVAAMHTNAAENNSDGEDDVTMDFFRGDPREGYPDPAEPLTNVYARDYQSLNGKWNYVVDEAGISHNYITNGNYSESETEYIENGWGLLEISFDSRRQLSVPGDWNSQVAELDRYRGRVVYHRQVDIQPEEGKRYFVHFGGANYTTDLYVNNGLVGRHNGGYTAFNFDITEFVRAGSNTIIVRVNAFLDDTTVPTMRTSDFWKYGGLTRDVGLVTVPETYIQKYHVFLADRASNEIRGWVQLDGENKANRAVTISIPEAGVKTGVSTNENGRAEFSVTAKSLALWSPRSPKLYDVSFGTEGNRIQDRIGFRTVEVDGLKILLNGKPLKLRGISMHEETILHPGLAHSREDVQVMFDLVKQLNANFVRLAHYPHNEHAVRLADELGLLLWSEVPIVSLIDWKNEETLDLAKNQVSENILRDVNRASVIMWSIANESFPQTDARLAFLTELARTVRTLDESGRPVVSALIGSHSEFREIGAHLANELMANPELPDADRQRLQAMQQQSAKKSGGEPKLAETVNVVINDPLGKVVDIVGYNEYFGWYYSKSMADNFGIDERLVRDAMLAIMPRIRFSNSFGKPMIISEFGAGALQGLRSKDAKMWSEDYQAKVYRAQLEMLRHSEYVQGYSPWVLKDFRSHLRQLNGIHGTYNRKGLVSETGVKKQSFEILADHYKKLENR